MISEKPKGPTGRIELRRLTVCDAVAMVLILGLSVALVAREALGLGAFSPGPAQQASVYRDGRLERLLPLREERQIPFQNGKMLIETRGGKVRVARSDCPRQVCVRTGWISHPGESIACVAFKTVIVLDPGGKPAFDAVVY